MCARFFVRPDVVEILRWLDATPDADLPTDDLRAPRWNVAPTQDVLAAALDPVTGRRHLGVYRWGFVPSWWREAKPPTWVNARCEDAGSGRAFRSAFRARRCLVPVSGFYEWKATGTRTKVPYAIGPADGPLMTLAGVYETWQGRPTLAILTCAPNPAMAELHDRMPVVVPREAWSTWLDARAPAEAIASLCAPWAGDLVIREVGSAVGNVRNTDGSWFG